MSARLSSGLSPSHPVNVGLLGHDQLLSPTTPSRISKVRLKTRSNPIFRWFQRITPNENSPPQKQVDLSGLQDGSIYKPLSQSSRDIRLILLHPCLNPREDIRCNLIQTSLNSRPKFEALSYTWGEPGIEEIITVDGAELRVRRNLFDALHHLRGTLERQLWIDAICIDQNNIAERNHQVKQMRSIYENAEKVVIWLGRANRLRCVFLIQPVPLEGLSVPGCCGHLEITT